MVPGLHVNNVVVLTVSISAALVSSFSLYPLAAFIVSMAVVHSFVDFIPSVLIGAPEEDSSLSVLPGHALLKEGRGYEAVRLTTLGGVYSLVFSLLFLPPLFFLVPRIYPYLQEVIPWLLGVVMVYMVSGEGRKWKSALLVFLLSGALGFLSLNHPSFSPQEVLFPLFSGLFGLSTLALSYRTNPSLGEQSLSFERVYFGRAGFAGFGAGLVAGFLPGIGSAQSAFLARGIFGRDIRGFLVAHGGVNTGEAVFSILALYLIGNPRSGASVGLEKLFSSLYLPEFLLFVSFLMVPCFVALVATLALARVAVFKVERFNYRWLSLGVSGVVLFLVLLLTGVEGLALALLSASIGIFAGLSGVKKSHCMGVLMLPTFVFYAF